VTHAAGDIRGGTGLTTILIFVGGEDTGSDARSAATIRRALQDLRDTPDVNVNFKVVGVKVPRASVACSSGPKQHAQQLKFGRRHRLREHSGRAPGRHRNADPNTDGTPSSGKTPEPTP
jgi:hypothetical protein